MDSMPHKIFYIGADYININRNSLYSFDIIDCRIGLPGGEGSLVQGTEEANLVR